MRKGVFMKKIGIILVNLLFLGFVMGCANKESGNIAQSNQSAALFNEWVRVENEAVLTFDLSNAHFGENAKSYMMAEGKSSENKEKVKIKLTGNIYHKTNNTNMAIIIVKRGEIVERGGSNEKVLNSSIDSIQNREINFEFLVVNNKLVGKVFKNPKNIAIRDYDTFLKNRAEFIFDLSDDGSEESITFKLKNK